MDRRQDNCSTGVPLPCGLFREPQGIAVFHPSGQAVPAQFRVALGSGKVQLSWTAPAGEPVRYQVKWADRPMVERLHWPEEKNAKANGRAANHVAGEPRPRVAETKESMMVAGIPAGKRYFAVRSFDAASNRSEISNMAETEVQ